MAGELYRTYEVLIEETVSPNDPRRGKTNKPGRYSAEIANALRDTNDIFQDAVCYYTLLLAGLVGNGDEGAELNPLWRHLRSKETQEKKSMREETDKVVRRLAERYPVLSGIHTAEEFLNKMYGVMQRAHLTPAALEMAEGELRNEMAKYRADTYRILEIQGTKPDEETGEPKECEKLNVFSNSWASILCDPDNETTIPGCGAYDSLLRRFQQNENWKASGADKSAWLKSQPSVVEALIRKVVNAAEEAGQAYQVKTERQLQQAIAKAKAAPDRKPKETDAKIEERVRREFTRKAAAAQKGRQKAYLRIFSPEKTRTYCSFAPADLARLNAEIAATPEASKRFVRLNYGKKDDNTFQYPLLRLLWVRDDADARVAAAADVLEYVFAEEPKAEPPLDDRGKAVEEMPYEELAPSLFPLFVKNILGVKSKTRSGAGRSAWWDFDVSAFATAAEDVFKYKIRTIDRAKRYAKMERARSAFLSSETSTLSKTESPSGKEMKILGMGDDPRRPVMEKLLAALAEKFEFDAYGLRPATIGGWTELRKTFRQREREAERNGWPTTTLVEKLEKEVEDAQGNSSEGFGSAAFFEMLCELEYHCLWSSKPSFAEANSRVLDRHTKNFVRHYVKFSMLEEDLRALEVEEDGKKRRAPIRFTWPGEKNRHGEISYRHFDFKTALKQQLGLELFRKLPSAEGQPAQYEFRDDYVVTLAARRLKRDRVMTASGNTIEAMWCPPLLLGENGPKVGKRSKNKKEGKDQEISFSLMVSSPAVDGSLPPVYLKVAVPITPGELKNTLRQERVNWGSSLAREKMGLDYVGTCFRWPTDVRVQHASKLRTLAEDCAFPDLQESLQQAANRLAAGDLASCRHIAKALADERKQGSGGKRGALLKKAEDLLKDAAEPLWCGDGQTAASKFKSKEKDLDEFHALSVDLNVRFAAAFSRLRVFINGGSLSANELAKTRRLSSDNFATDIRAHAYRRGTLRLPGEDTKVWQSGAEPEIEPYGSKGRMPSPEEKTAFEKLADELVPVSSFALRGVDGLSIPEMGDVLVRRLRRRLGRTKFLFKLRWQLVGSMERNPDTHTYTKPRKDIPGRQEAHRRTVVELLGKIAFPEKPREDESEHPDNRRLRDKLNPNEEAWKSIREDLKARKEQAEEQARCARLKSAVAGWDWSALATEAQAQLDTMFAPTDGRQSTAELLAVVANHCLPLRGRVWRWRAHELEMTGKPEHKPLIRGMRGLNIRRIEQISDLRQCCQSLAKLEKRHAQGATPGKPGVEPTPTSRGDIVDDPCPELLQKRNETREQRVNQIAHMILAEALGLELEDPSKVEWLDKESGRKLTKKEANSLCDLHGRYRQIKDGKGNQLPRCNVIVLENLSRYRTNQDRSRSENTQLMNWCHRAVVEKLQDIAKPFGITIMMVDAAYSSRFHSLSGVPGVRVNSVPRGFHEQMPYAAWAKERTKRGKRTERAKWIRRLAWWFRCRPQFAGELLVPVDGGKEFIGVETPNSTTPNGLMNADENAAINIGLRALAHPDRLDIFHRIQTEAASEDALKVRNRRGYFAELEKADEARLAKCQPKPQAESPEKPQEDDDDADDDSLGSESRPNLFFIPNGSVTVPVADVYRNARFEAARFGIYWGRVKQLCDQRLRAMNKSRLESAKAAAKRM